MTPAWTSSPPRWRKHLACAKTPLLWVDDNVGDAPNADDIADQNANNYIYNTIGQLAEDVSEGIAYIYTTSGLVAEVQRNGQPLVKFLYNDRNHRMRKETYFLGNLIYTTHYVRDVAGQVMAVYSDVGGNLALAEQPVYGSGRIGVAYANGNNAMTYVYELTDHLGNVRAVFTKNGNGADLEGFTDYYPGGMAMPGRNMIGDYRYNYQGQEKDDETGKIAFELRLYDPRINRWLSPDPARQYASPYLSMGNNWISRVDPDGGEDNPVFGSDGTYRGTTKEGFTGESIIYDGDMDFSNMSAGDLVGSGGTYLSSFDFSSPTIRDNIESFIVNANIQDGLDLIQEVTIQSSVENGRDFLYSAEKATQSNYVILRQLDRKGNSQADKFFEPTVENLRNLVNAHEVIGHVALGMSGSVLNHYYIYKSQVNRHQFNSTTDRFKAHILSKFFYHAQRTGNEQNFLNNTRYNSLFYKYGYEHYLESYHR